MYRDPPGRHRHKCCACRYVWDHSDDAAGVPGAHLCPVCGVEELWKYLGGRAPDTTHPRDEELTDGELANDVA